VFNLSGFREHWLFQKGNDEVRAVHMAGDLKLSSALAIRQCALDGLGPALLANWLIDADLSDGSLVDLFPDYSVTATDFDTGPEFYIRADPICRRKSGRS
jgi:DNA-binding transcriptional LysR family regulator